MSKVRADNYSNRLGTGAPNFPDGLNVDGNVSIAGTLTYQDVESVDSLGIVTARSGIQVLANGINAVGVVTATSFSGDGSSLSGIDAAPSFTGVASGSLTNGQAVALTDDGKVIAVSGAGVTASIGSTSVFEDQAVHFVTTVYDSANDRVVIAYQDGGNSNYGTAVVGVITDKTMHFGTPVVFNSGATKFISACYDSNAEKVFIAYEDDDNSDKGRAVVGDVTPGTNTITFGSEALFSNEVVAETTCAFDSVNNKVVVAWKDNVYYGAAAVGTITGTAVTFGSPATFEEGAIGDPASAFHAKSGQVVISYYDTGDSNNGRVVAGTVVGTAITFGRKTTFDATQGIYGGMVYDPDEEKVVIAYQDYVGSGNSPTKAIVCDVERTNVVTGPSHILHENSGQWHKLTYVNSSKKIALLMDDADQENVQDGWLKFLQIIPNTMSLNVTDSYIWNANPGYSGSIVYHPKQDNLFIAFRNNQNNYYGSGLIFQQETHHSTMTSGNFLGFSDAAYSNGDSAKIQLVGSIDDAQSGLTTGRKHFVQPSGGIGLTAYPTLQVEAGTAISATQILVR